MTRKQKKLLWQILISGAMLVILHFLPVTGLLGFGLYLLPYLLLGHGILRKAVLGIFHGQIFDENFLMAVATIGALVLGLTYSGDYAEAVAVMLFFQIGQLFESYAVGKSRKSIRALMDIRPDHANILQDGVLVQVDPEDVPVGSILTVRPGEKIPIDGVILSGHSTLDTSALTGESLPREVAEADAVISGCINLTGLLQIRTTKDFSESTVSKILELVENASSRKSRSEAFIVRFARYYTPLVCLSALAVATLPPLLSALWGMDGRWSLWLYRALSFLVASCPCALVISIPLTFFAGIGGASRAGILVKGSNYLEALAKTHTVVLDKTGTLTQGSFSVTEISADDPQALLEYAALAEYASSHPISQGLRQAYGKPIDASRVQNVREESGHGVFATVDGIAVAVGNAKLMASLGLSPAPNPGTGTCVYVALEGKLAGYLLLSDTLKPSAPQAIEQLRHAGVRRTVMLTGDHATAAAPIVQALHLDQVHSQLLPGDKVEKVEALLTSLPQGKKLVFVGDGINDAPVLSRADIGIAMGALGSDAAIEAADVVLMDDDPRKISKAIAIARTCMGIVYQNIVFAIGIKVLALILVALGFANMWLAIFADVGVMVLAILNAIRAMFIKKG